MVVGPEGECEPPPHPAEPVARRRRKRTVRRSIKDVTLTHYVDSGRPLIPLKSDPQAEQRRNFDASWGRSPRVACAAVTSTVAPSSARTISPKPAHRKQFSMWAGATHSSRTHSRKATPSERVPSFTPTASYATVPTLPVSLVEKAADRVRPATAVGGDVELVAGAGGDGERLGPGEVREDRSGLPHGDRRVTVALHQQGRGAGRG